MILREVEALLRGHTAIADAFDRARVPDRLLAYAYETLRKHGIQP